MTILFYEGFDFLNNGSQNNYDLIDLSSRFIVTSNWYVYLDIVAGGPYGTGQYLRVNSSQVAQNSIQIPISQPLTSFCIGCHINIRSNSGYTDIFTIQPETGSNYIRLTTSNGSDNRLIHLNINGTLNNFTIIDSLDVGQWQYIELQGQVTGTNQVLLNIYVNGMLAGTYTGIGFTATPYSWSKFIVGYGGSSGNTQRWVDNLYLTSGEQLGIVEVKTMLPSGDTAQKDGIPVTGSTNYSQLAAYTLPMNSHFVALTSETANDVYDLSNLNLNSSDYDILAAQGISIMKQSTTPDVVSGNVGLMSSGNLVSGVAQNLDQTSFSTITTPILNTDPATSSPWTPSAIDSLQLMVGREAPSGGSTPYGFYIDSSGAYPTTVSSSTIISGDTPPTVSSGALVFNGSQNIRYTDVPFWHVVPDYSVEFDFYTSSTSTNQCIATVGGHVQLPQWPEWTIFIASNNVTFYSNSNATSGGTTTSANFFTSGFSPTTWYKIGFMIYSSGTYRVRGYLNGTQSFDVPIAGGTIGDSSFGFACGGDNSKDSGRQFTGGIRNFRMGNELFWPV